MAAGTSSSAARRCLQEPPPTAVAPPAPPPRPREAERTPTSCRRLCSVASRPAPPPPWLPLRALGAPPRHQPTPPRLLSSCRAPPRLPTAVRRRLGTSSARRWLPGHALLPRCLRRPGGAATTAKGRRRQRPGGGSGGSSLALGFVPPGSPTRATREGRGKKDDLQHRKKQRRGAAGDTKPTTCGAATPAIPTSR